MRAEFFNVYADRARAAAYAQLEFPGTYYLAFRDLPAILIEHIHGRRAVDFGCGTGRSTRFLRTLGFDVVGVDISGAMLAQARARDPQGIIVWCRTATSEACRPTAMISSFPRSPSTMFPRWRRRWRFFGR
jgi:predicted TPR repeat methyltransferase